MMSQQKAVARFKALLEKPKEYYIGRIKERFGDLDIKQVSRAVLFGAAEMGKIYIDLCRKNKIEVLAVCDNDASKSGSFLTGVKVISLSELQKFPKNTPIIITTIYDDEVREQLAEIGFTCVFSQAYLSVIYPDKFHNQHWLSSVDEIFAQKDEVLRCFHSLTDEISRDSFLNIIEYRLSLDRACIKKIMRPKEEEYFDKNIVSLNQNEIFVDGGAYVGDTIAHFLRVTGGRFQAIHSFEPDVINFSKLERYVSSLADPRIFTYPMALGEADDLINFSNEGALGSRINRSAATAVKITALDNLLYKFKPTMIKLDVEGWEMEALKGAQKTIVLLLPKLAVCVYHKPADLWQLPLFLEDNYPEFQFFIRHYSQFLYDTVCYAVKNQF